MLSIIIPAFNEEKYIEETLKSLPKEHEIIVVCNGCTDNTEEVAKKYTDNVYVLKEKGVSRAKNFGASKTKHEKLIFLDADIVIDEKVVNAIENSKYELGTIMFKPNVNNFKAKLYIFLKNIWSKLYLGGGVIYCTKEVYKNAKGFEENISYKEDIRFLKRAQEYKKYKPLNTKGIVNMRRYEKAGYLKPLLIMATYWLW